MSADAKSCLLLCEPIEFYSVCTIYPIEVQEYIKNPSFVDSLYMPFALSSELISDEYEGLSIFEVIMCDMNTRIDFIEALRVFCRTENIKTTLDLISDPSELRNIKEFEVIIDDNPESLNKNNFDEFADIILLSGCRERFKKKAMPEFATEDGKKRWLELEAKRNKYKENESPLMSSVINLVLSGGRCYVPEDAVKHWSVWKLYNTYSSTIGTVDYDRGFQANLQGADVEITKKHWSELLKIN